VENLQHVGHTTPLVNQAAELPPLGDTLVNSANLLLQNTFFPFEAPQSIPANIVLTGPALSRYMRPRLSVDLSTKRTCR
jgi:hypothetical protein